MKLLIILVVIFSYSYAANVNTTVRLNSGYDCPIVGLGTGGFRSGGPPQDKVVIQMVHDATDVGYKHIDTASAYLNEKAVGQA
ncbi:unnamed protein product, partial [Oppiella nova]